MGIFIESGMYFLWLLPTLIPYMIIYAMFYKKNDIRNYGWHFLGVIVFSLLLSVMLNVTGSATLIDILIRKSPYIHIENLNLIPFAGDAIISFGVIMNILMFVPFGFLVPLLWKEKDSIVQTGFIGMFFSLIIEISQLFNFRACDITDLITNTLGSLLGWVIFRLLLKNSKLRRKFAIRNTNRKAWYLKQEVVIFLIYYFVCSFWIKGWGEILVYGL